MMQIRDRIRELRRVRAAELAPNPKNWRTHPPRQQNAMRGILAEIGYADALLARERPDGRLLLIDGHLRAEITPDSLVPVLIVDLADDEADKLLALFDPLGALAGTDGARLNALVAGINTDSAALREVLSELATTVQTPAGMNDSTGDELAPEYSIIVDCDDEAQQVSLLARFAEEGLRCRAFVV